MSSTQLYVSYSEMQAYYAKVCQYSADMMRMSEKIEKLAAGNKSSGEYANEFENNIYGIADVVEGMSKMMDSYAMALDSIIKEIQKADAEITLSL